MKILFLDFIYAKGHESFNKNILECLMKFSETYIFSQQGYYKHYENDLKDAIINEKNDFKKLKGSMLSRLRSLYIMSKSATYSKKIKADVIFVTCFETLSFALGRHFFKDSKKIYIFHHNNTDELINRTKRKVFSRYMNKVNHIVYEEFIKEYLVVEIGVDPQRVSVLPHPMNEFSVVDRTKSCNLCIALSNSNNELWINSIIAAEKDQKKFMKSNTKLVVKSKSSVFDDEYLKVFKGFLEKSKYDEYVSNSSIVFIPFPDKFKNRMSGTLVDALSSKKIVIGTDIPLMNIYANKYPHICKIVSNIDELIYELDNIKYDGPSINMEFEKFIETHSKVKIVSSLKELFGRDCNV